MRQLCSGAGLSWGTRNNAKSLGGDSRHTHTHTHTHAMSSPGSSQAWTRERRSSFFKLIDSFAVEIGTLKKEMVRKREPPADRERDDAPAPFGLGEEVGGLFLQTGPPAGLMGAPAGVRDSGYDSLRWRLSILDRLMQTHGVWLQLGLSHQEATRVLQSQPTGTFVVRRSASLQRKVISVRMEQNSSQAVRDFPVRESQYAFSLDGSGLSFADLFRLVAFCCISRDVLPFTLKLPQAIAAARTSADLEHIGKLGSGFWNQSQVPVRTESPAAVGAPSSAQEPEVNKELRLGGCWLKVRSPSQLDCCSSNGALCFINPLFLKVHSGAAAAAAPLVAASCSSDSSQQGNSGGETSQKPGGAKTSPRPRPPRPPPPRLGARSPATPQVAPPSMPEKIPWLRSRPRLGSSPISIPVPSRSRTAAPASSQDDAQCHLALQDSTIEQALLRAKLHLSHASRGSAPDPAQASSPCSSDPPPDALGPEEGVEVEQEQGGGQRLSDISFSTGSTDSLDRSTFFLPPLYDPSLPTEADLDLHLPVTRPYSSMEEDEEDQEDEDQDYGVSLDSDQDQDQDVTMVPPGLRRSSSAALALQQRIRKVSGVFHTLLTPERRAVRRVVELSRNRATYFGCLVQDYVTYMGEGATLLGFASGPELLQTLRQFITQMKSYLKQSSELQPPIVSLIPEDQIDRVLEKAMLKCVLKPLRAVVSTALREFQVRSGEWQELKDNLALAKARQPQEMGVSDIPALPPPPTAIERIRSKFQTMVKRYSPEKKVALLLSVCKLIYALMEDNTGRPYGADDFLPMLTYVLAQCDMPQLDNEILYMMELLDPTLLHGEGGYYLTSAYGAMSLLRHFREDQAAQVLSSQTTNTLHQWHRRRTDTLRAAPSINDFQNYLRVALQELDSGCTAKTLPVAPYATAEEVCRLCALKFKVSDPEAYGLFLVTEDSSQQLAPDTHPQKIKAELHSGTQLDHFHFVYRRLAMCGASPDSASSSDSSSSTCSTLPNLNQLVLEQNLVQNLGPGLRLSLPPAHLDNTLLSV